MSKGVVTVTGGAGYLGAHLVPLLLESGWQVRVIDNFTYGAQGLARCDGHPRLTQVKGDICNIRDMVKVIKGSDAVIALAAIVGDPACALSEDETLCVNYEATKILVELCNWHKVSRLLFASTCSVYGANSVLLLNEGSWLNPISLYAQTRIMSEQVVLAKSSPTLVPAIFRMATLYGQSARMRYDLSVNLFSARASVEGRMQVFGGEQWRPFIHVRDAARAYLLALEAPADTLDREIFNLGDNDQNYCISEVAEMVRREAPEAEIETYASLTDARDYRASFDKIAHALGFRAEVSLREGAREMMEQARRIDFRADVFYNVKYIYRDTIPAGHAR
ncbi:MAG: NAD-dependent epimerase/dehydratase family protein [Armatimonadetes bacterium]|nr:NAD-dependent epimerase/dehydratase family protein [Armatimonadota bacterium]